MIERYTAEELALWSGGNWLSGQPRKISGISKDTRTIQKNDVYVALVGANHDGHDFIGDAVAKGASGLIINASKAQLLSDNESVSKCPKLIVSDTHLALRDMACAYRDKVDPDIIGITGSAGKSTVKEMTAQILGTTYNTSSTLGNWNNDIGMPLSLMHMDSLAEKGVFEVGMNHPGEISSLCAILRPKWGVVSNVGPVHIEFFDSVDAIANEKCDLLRSLPADGVAVLNADDEYFEYFRKAIDVRVISVSEKKQTDYSYAIITDTGKVLVEEKSTGEEMAFMPVLPGLHNVVNAVMATAVARGHGVEWADIRIALQEYNPLPMRWEEVDINGIRLINDAYNANPLSMRASLSAFEKEAVNGGKWLVLAGMGELGRSESEEHRKLGEFIGAGDWCGVILVGDKAEMIAGGIRSADIGIGIVHCCHTNEEAARMIRKYVKERDAVLLKASRAMKLEEIVYILQQNDQELCNNKEVAHGKD